MSIKKRYAYRLGTIIFALMLIPLIVAGMIISAKAPEGESTAPIPTIPTIPTIEAVETIVPQETVPITEETIPSEPEPTKPESTEPEPPVVTEPSVESVPFPQEIEWHSDRRVYPLNTVTTTAGGAEIDIDFLAKLLYCEAGDMTKLGKIYTCSAILNFCDEYNLSVWRAGHSKSCFKVAPYVDDAKPTDEEYEIIDHVLNGGRIEEICHFRTKRYHKFGTPICEIDGHYFSIKEK